MQSMSVTQISKLSTMLMLTVASLIALASETLSTILTVNYTVSEEEKVGTLIGRVSHDIISEKEIKVITSCQLFDLSSRKQWSKLLRVKSSSCDLFVNSRIDREQLCGPSKCVMQISVYINAKEWVTVNIEIIDINDNSPKFDPTSISLSFNENSKIGHSIDLPIATDIDMGPNSFLSYSLHPPLSLFELVYTNSGPLRLVLRGPLDYEKKSHRQFSATVTACDDGSPRQCGKLNLKISVTDMNDNRPIFTRCNESVNIIEDTQISKTIYQISAQDFDDGDNGRVTYEINPNPDNKVASEYFSVHSTKGDIKLSKSLHTIGVPEKFSLTLTARDHGPVPLSSECKIIFSVIDINNHAPKIEINPTLPGGYLRINENIGEVTTVALVTVTDEDKNNNAKVTCELINTSPIAALENWNGLSVYKLLLLKPVDREKTTAINISISCRDHGSPSRLTTKYVSIAVVDVNEYPPVININPTHIVISENQVLNTSIALFKTYDQDPDANVTISLRSDTDGLFSIDSRGNLMLKKHIDREERSLYGLLALAIDNSPPVYHTTSLSFTVTVTDVNDNRPKLLGPQSFHLLENLFGSTSKIGQLKAYDPDQGLNGSVKFKFLDAVLTDGSPINNSFSINENDGVIFSNSPIDREVTPEIILRILLMDQGRPKLTKEEKIHLTIADENDNKPIWQFPSLENCKLNLSVVPASSKYSERHSLITVVKVSDPDSPENANITFKLVSATKDSLPVHIFILEPLTGHLMGVGVITEGDYILKMQASDNGRPVLLSEVATLYIYAYSSNAGFFSSDTDRLSLTLIVALASVTCIICISLLVAIIVVRRHRYSSIQYASNGHTNDHNSLVNDSLTKWTEEQNQYLDSWNYPSHYCSYPIIPGMQKFSTIGEPLLPPPGPKDVLNSMNNSTHICPVMHLRRPTNQDIDVSSADSGRGASEEENMLNEAKNRESIRTRSKMYPNMPPISSLCSCQDSMGMCGSCSNSLGGQLHYQYVTYSPTSYQTFDDSRSSIQFHTSRPMVEQSAKNYHTLDTMVTATSMGSHTDVIPMDSVIQQNISKDISSFLGPHSNV